MLLKLTVAYTLGYYVVGEVWGLNFMSKSDADNFVKTCSVSGCYLYLVIVAANILLLTPSVQPLVSSHEPEELGQDTSSPSLSIPAPPPPPVTTDTTAPEGLNPVPVPEEGSSIRYHKHSAPRIFF